METNERLRKQILEIIQNQLRDNEPPETKATYDRLLTSGFDESQTLQMIGQCLLVELYKVGKLGIPDDKDRYINTLKALPKESFD